MQLTEPQLMDRNTPPHYTNMHCGRVVCICRLRGYLFGCALGVRRSDEFSRCQHVLSLATHHLVIINTSTTHENHHPPPAPHTTKLLSSVTPRASARSTLTTWRLADVSTTTTTTTNNHVPKYTTAACARACASPRIHHTHRHSSHSANVDCKQRATTAGSSALTVVEIARVSRTHAASQSILSRNSVEFLVSRVLLVTVAVFILTSRRGVVGRFVGFA